MNYISDDIKIYRFPREISFESVPGYLNSFSINDDVDKVIFDLSKTEVLHVSFIGLLLHAKRISENNGSIFQLLMSDKSRRLIRMMNLDNHFCGENVESLAIKTA